MNKPAYIMTFSDLLARIKDDLELHPQRAANLKSSIRRFLKIAGWVETMEASFPRARRELKSSMPAKFGVGKATWANTKCDLNFVLNRYGAPTREPLRKHLLGPWTKLRDVIDHDPKFARGLSNFIHFCSAHDISPQAVDDDVMQLYFDSLTNRSLKAGPEARYRNVCKLWNKAVDTFNDWP